MSGDARCWDAEVVGVRDAGEFQVLTVSGAPAPGRPGQFAAVSVGRERLLRRQLWLDTSSDSSDLLELVAGPASDLGRRTRGDRVNVIAPLGRPFSMPREPLSVLLIGFGQASAALPPLAAALVAQGCRVGCLLLGEPVYGRMELRRLASTMSHEVLPDSVDSLRAVVADALEPSPDLVYSAGDAAEVAQYADLLATTPHQVAVMLDRMCGTGVCQGCVLPVRGNDGVPRLARVCRDGAVFHSHHVLWQDRGADFDRLIGSAP